MSDCYTKLYKLREKQRYELTKDEEAKKTIREKWRKENEELLASIERFL